MRHSLILVALSKVMTLGGCFAGIVNDVVWPGSAKSLNDTCSQIRRAMSTSSQVFFPSDVTGHYTSDNAHTVSSSSQPSACSVEPGTAEDVGIVLRILGNNKTPFAVKGGGHAMNPGFSSTPGVQIAMARFNQVKYSPDKQTVEVGAGLVWDDVYAALDPVGASVVGGRVSGIGVAGFTLGGGYSWLSNQYGLALDNVVSFELVLPEGSVRTITESDTDLFFALKGGFNNFGIVTNFTLNTHAQGQVWGGYLVFPGDIADQVNAATLKFVTEVTDPKAAILSTFVYDQGSGTPMSFVEVFYDGPTPPADVFDDYLAMPALLTNVSTRSLVSLIEASSTFPGTRGVFHTVAVEAYDQVFLDAIINETITWGQKIGSAPGAFIGYTMEPFLPSLLTHGSNSAYPPVRTQVFLPTCIIFSWDLESSDQTMYDAVKQSEAHLTAVAKHSGQNLDNAPLYNNYAMFDTPLQKMYGDNLVRLKKIKSVYDPFNVMGQAGGWKF